MDEIKNDTIQEEVVAQDVTAEETTCDVAEDTASQEPTAESTEEPTNGKKKIKLPAWLQKLVDKINSNEDVRQMVVFTLFSFICGGSQMILTYLLALMKYAGGTLASPFTGIPVGNFFLFGYDTTAEFIGFLVGSVVGQVLTFVLNRKKTFNCTNNIVLSGIMYVILAVFIIFMQTLLGGAITSACHGAVPDASGFLDLVFNLAGQAVAGIAALIISFLGNKFLVMRNWGEGKKKKAEEYDCEECHCSECACAHEESECNCDNHTCDCCEAQQDAE